MTDPSNLLEDTSVDEIHVDESKNYLEELVGDNKKFKTPEDLAKGKYVSDNYIQILERRLDEMRDEYKKVREENIAGQKLQDLLDKLENQQLPSRDKPKDSNEDKAVSYDPKEVESLVSSSILRYEQTKKETENFNSVREKLQELYGRNYKDALKEQSEILGLTDDEVNSMARRSPKLFFKTFDLDKQRGENFQAPPRSDKRSDSFAPRKPERRTWSYYQDLKKKNPLAWMDKKIAIQMEKDAQALGQDFYDV